MSADGFTPESMWTTLDLAPTDDRTAIRRAYARWLKVTNPEDDAAGFATLRTAYEAALAYVDATASEAYHCDDEPEKPGAGKTRPDSARSVEPDLNDVALGDLGAQTVPSPLMAEFAAAHAEAQGRLQAALECAVSDADLLSALDIILSSPVLDRTEGKRAAEAWLALLIVDNRPHSDVLIQRVIARFDWTVAELEKRDLDAEQRSMRQWICRRGRDLIFLRALQNPDYDYHDAYCVLSRPPQRLTLQSLYFPAIAPKRIAAFLDRVRRSQPTIESDLNPRTVSQWEGKLSRPQFSVLNLWLSTVAAICLPIMVGGWFTFPPNVAAGTTILLGFPVIWAVFQLTMIYAFARPRWLWRQNIRGQTNPVLAYGWGPLFIALLFLMPIPPWAGSTWLILALSSLNAWWVIITGDADERATQWPWYMRAAFGEAPLGMLLIFSARGLPAEASWQMTIVFAAASIVSCFGQQPLLRLWDGLKLSTQRHGQTAAALICLGTIALLWLTYSDPNLHPLCFAAMLGAVLLHRVPVKITDRRFAAPRRITFGAGIFIAVVMSNNVLALPIFGTLVLAWAVLNCIVARSETK